MALNNTRTPLPMTSTENFCANQFTLKSLKKSNLLLQLDSRLPVQSGRALISTAVQKCHTACHKKTRNESGNCSKVLRVLHDME